DRVPRDLRVDRAGRSRCPRGLRRHLGRTAAGPRHLRSHPAADPAALRPVSGRLRRTPDREHGLAPRAAGRGYPRGMTEHRPEAPVPAHRPTERTFHGDTVIDPYEWMRDKT